jgi:molecular chaperone GrpE
MKDKHKKNEEKNEKENEVENHEEIKEKEELQLRIDALEIELQDYKDRLLRKAAEFENYKRRTEIDQLNLIRYGGEGFIRRILPIVDDFERSLLHMEKTSENDPVKEGIKLVYDKLLKILNDQGVKKIEAVGKEFDVHFHEAIMQRKADNVKPHTVLDEVETGYIFNDKVIRHSKVIVSEDNSSQGNSDPEISDNTNNEENE